MTVKELYEDIRGDYDDIITRFASDELILYFLKQFPLDNSYNELMEAVKNNDIAASFVSAHKLKGLVANLSFSELFAMLNSLSEQLRPKTEPADAVLIQKISESYNAIVREISRLEKDERA